MLRQFGIPRICYAPDAPPGGGTTPPGGSAPPLGGGAADSTPPWGSDPNAMWMIGNEPWFNKLIPEGPTRELMSAKQYKNPVVVADSYNNVNKMLNVDTRVAIPNYENAKPEEITAYYDKRGRPANADAYEIKAPDGVTYNPDLLKFGKGLAHELGLHPKEAQIMTDKYNKFATEHFQAQALAEKTANDTAIKALETKWGADLPANKEAGLRVIKALGLDDTVLAGVEKSLGAAPIVDLLVRIGKASAEGGGFKGGGGGSDGDANTPEAAAAEISRLRTDPDFEKRLNDINNSGHRDAVQKLEQLYAKAGRLAT